MGRCTKQCCIVQGGYGEIGGATTLGGGFAMVGSQHHPRFMDPCATFD